ncbi:MAG: hypothetical protein MJ116_10660 [Lachnospiraceae bacterium]|nr:hypothetical protein [Lachnospiraceae bacterium]
MAKTVKFKSSAAGDKKLMALQEQLGALKTDLADLIQEYDEKGVDEGQLDALTEVLDALEDAWDGLDEVLEEA